jgi:hypothetical protein
MAQKNGFRRVSFLVAVASISDKPLHPAYIFRPRAHRRGRMMRLYAAGNHSALDLDGAGERLVPLPGVCIFSPLGRRWLEGRILPIQQIKASERGGNFRARKAFGG